MIYKIDKLTNEQEIKKKSTPIIPKEIDSLIH